MQTKRCSKCRETKTLTEFRPEPRAADGVRYSCRECDRERNRQYVARERTTRIVRQRASRVANPERHKAYRTKYVKKNRARMLIRGAQRRAAKMGLAFDLDRHQSEIQSRIDAGACELSGTPFNLKGRRTHQSPSLDRIEPAKGYVYANIRVVCLAMNCALGNWGEDALEVIVRAWLAKRK